MCSQESASALPDICPFCFEPCELNGDEMCYECQHFVDEGEVSTFDCLTCEDTGLVWQLGWDVYYGAIERQLLCPECQRSTRPHRFD